MIATTSLIAVNDGQIGTGRVGWGLHEAAIKAFASRRRPFRTAMLFRSIDRAREVLSAKVTGRLSPAGTRFV
jgi:hypothetical protein